ncbi:THO complex subunit 7 like [Pseudolycoriella hygida]|uniref:THO complex subunit 7 like n=1 Tax=Pseudolycoriella hygida TaxID=35572 RepID=A0A9Q0NFT5_9DIPT|nr:THO complex subunit 7 like [Pseudolycoriella hygida]
MSDEEVIKRRLLIDGDGTGDDRRLNVLIKMFTKWCNSTETPENELLTYNRMLAQLVQCEFAVVKSEYSAKMMKLEKKNYEKVSSKIDLAIIQTKKQIDESKEKLVLAKKIRKNRMEYDVLAKIISQQPDRRKTTEKLRLLKKDLSELKSVRQQLESKMEVRKNEFSVLMRSIKELQNKLDDFADDGDGDIVARDVDMLEVVEVEK